MTNTTKDTIDGSQMLGAEINGDTYSCIIDDTMKIQRAYHFISDVSEYRSVDGENENILSWRPKTHTYQRHRQWRESGFHIPEDVSLSDEALGVLTDVRGVSRDDGEITVIEIYTPPLSEDGAMYLKQMLLCKHGIIANKGVGRDPLIVRDPESVETLKSYQREW